MVTKDFKCDSCGKVFEQKVSVKESNPKCECGSGSHWLPRLNKNGHQIKYTLRVLCDGFKDASYGRQ